MRMSEVEAARKKYVIKYLYNQITQRVKLFSPHCSPKQSHFLLLLLITYRAAFRVSKCCFSCLQHRCRAFLTHLRISSVSSPIYSFPVPLKGILVLTMETKTPTRSRLGSIL